MGRNAGLQGHVLDAHGEPVFTQHIAQLLRSLRYRAVERDAVAAAANTHHGVLFATQLERITQHGAVKDKSTVREQVAARSRAALLAYQGAAVEVGKKAQRPFHKNAHAGIGAGREAELIDAQVQVQRHIKGLELFAETQGHAQTAVHRVKDNLQACRQHTRLVDCTDEFLQRGDQHPLFVYDGPQSSARNLCTGQCQGFAIDHPLNGVGAQGLHHAGHFAPQRDLFFVQELGIKTTQRVDQGIHHCAIDHDLRDRH